MQIQAHILNKHYSQGPILSWFDFGSVSLTLQDVVTYYLNLTHANLMVPAWEEEYRLTSAFQVPDGSTHSMQTVLERISKDAKYLQQYYEFNSVRYDLALCGETCRADHVCAIREVDFTRYEECLKANSSTSAIGSVCLLLLSLLFGICGSQQTL